MQRKRYSIESKYHVFFSILSIILCIAILVACNNEVQSRSAQTEQLSPTPIPEAQISYRGIYGKGSAKDMSWSPDGSMLVVESTAGGFVYDTATWEVLASIPTDSFFNNGLSNLVFYPDNQSIFFKTSVVIDNAIKSVYWRYNIHQNTITQVFENIDRASYYKPLFSPDGTLLAIRDAACNTDNICQDIIKLYDPISEELIRTIPVSGFDSSVDMNVIAFSPDSQFIASAGIDNKTRLWDVTTGALLYIFEQESDVNSLSFNEDGTILISTGNDAAIRFWDVPTGENLFSIHGKTDEFYMNSWFFEHGKKVVANFNYNQFREFTLDEAIPDLIPNDISFETEERIYDETNRSYSNIIVRPNPAGNKLAVMINATIQIWDLQTGKQVQNLPEYNRRVNNLKLSPDGNLLLLIDHQINMWQVSPKKYLGIFETQEQGISDVAFSCDGSIIAVAIPYKPVEIWNIQTHELIGTLQNEAPSLVLSFSPDGKQVAVINAFEGKIFDINSGSVLKRFTTEIGTPIRITFTLNGDQLIAAGSEGYQAWNTGTGEQLYQSNWNNEKNWKIALSPSLMIASNNHIETLSLYNPVRGTYLYDMTGGRGSNTIELSSDGRLLALDDYNGISLMDSISGEELSFIEFDLPYFLEVNKNNSILAASSYHEAPQLWDITALHKIVETNPEQTPTANIQLTTITEPTSTPAPTLFIPTPMKDIDSNKETGQIDYSMSNFKKLGDIGLGRISMSTWTPDGKALAIGGYAGIYLFNFGSASPTRFFPIEGFITNIAFSSDGLFMAGQIANYKIMIWNTNTGEVLQTIDSGYCWNSGMSFNTEKTILTAKCTGAISAWEVDTGALLEQSVVPPDFENKSKAGDLSIRVNMVNVQLFNNATDEIIKTFEIPGMAPSMAKFSPEKTTLAVWHYQYEIARTGVYVPGKEDRTTLQLWKINPDDQPVLISETETGKWEQSSLILTDKQILEFSPDSKWLATSSGDNNIQIWDAKTGALVSTLPGGGNLAFSPNAKYLAAIDDNGAHIWNILQRSPNIVWNISGFNRNTFQLIFSEQNSRINNVTEEFVKNYAIQKDGAINITSEVNIPDVYGHNISMSPDGKQIVYRTMNGIMIGNNNQSNPQWRSLRIFDEPLTYDTDLDLTFSNHGLLLATYGPDRMARLADLANETVIELETIDFIDEFLFNPDDTLLFGSYAKTSDPTVFYLWDTKTGELLNNWNANVYKFVIHPNQPYLIGVNFLTGEIMQIDIQNWGVHHLGYAEIHCRALAISPDGKLLVFAYDNTIEIRQAEDFAILYELPIGTRHMAFSSDGKMLAIAFNDGRIEYWGWNPK